MGESVFLIAFSLSYIVSQYFAHNSLPSFDLPTPKNIRAIPIVHNGKNLRARYEREFPATTLRITSADSVHPEPAITKPRARQAKHLGYFSNSGILSTYLSDD